MLKYILLFSLVFIFQACQTQDEKIKRLVQSIEKNMVYVKGGTFMMGDPGYTLRDNSKGLIKGNIKLGTPENRIKYPNFNEWKHFSKYSKKLKKVHIKNYYISKYEITWEQFDLYYNILGKEYYKKDQLNNIWRSPKMPVGTPNFDEAKNFCKFLSKHTHKNFTLANEAQWEYAARSRGKYVLYATNDGFYHGKYFKNDEVGWIDSDNKNVATDYEIVGSNPPNPLGIYDMTNNRSEWVLNYYEQSDKKVIRGSSSGDDSHYTVFARNLTNKDSNLNTFRCVYTP